jgi:glutaredoxin
MILILGKPDCNYCKFAVALLRAKMLTHRYVDITTISNNWKPILNKLFPSVKIFPVIFDVNQEIASKEDLTLEDLESQMLIGNYFDLEELIQESCAPPNPQLS